MKIIILFQFLFISVITFPQITFQKTYGGNDYEEANEVVQTNDDGFIVVGYTETFGAGNRDFYVVKTQPDGDTIWTKTFGGANYDQAHCITKADESHYIIGGYTSSFGAGGDIYLIKIDENGNAIWTKAIGTQDNDHISKIRKTSDGGFIICGDIEHWGQYKYYIVKTDSNCDTIWTKAYDYGIAKSIIQTNDGGYALIVYPYSTSYWRYDFQLVKLNQFGEIIWSKFYGGQDPDFEIGFALEQTTDNGYLLAGRADGYGSGASDFLIIKTNNAGDSLWSKTFGGASDERAFTVIKTSDGGFLIGGYTGTFGGGFFDFYIVKTDENGDSLWTRTYGGSWQEMAYDIKETNDGGFVIAGYTQTYGAGLFDFYLVKTDANGLLTGVENQNNHRIDFELYQNYPNPFNPSTRIQYQVPFISQVVLKIFDVLGNEIATLVNEEKPAGGYEVEFNAEKLASGIYFYRLQVADFIQTKKMLLLK